MEAATKLIQKEFFKGTQSFEIHDNEIQVQCKLGWQHRKYNVPFNVLSKNTEINKGTDYIFLIISILLTFLALGFAVFAFIAGSQDFIGFIVISIFLFLCAVSGFKVHKKREYNCLIYFDIFSGQPALVLWIDNPERETFTAFSGQINERLSKQNFSHMASDSSIANEIHKFYELWQKGIISEEEFKAGKAKILGTEGDDWKY